MKREQIARALGETELFGSLDKEALNALANRVSARAYGDSQYIFWQGDSSETMFLLVEGSVRITVVGEDGAKMVLATLEAPATFGELSLLDGGARSASVETVGQAAVLVITRETVFQLMREHEVLVAQFFQGFGSMVRRLTGQAADFVFLDLAGRVAKALHALASRRGAPEGPIDISLTQSDLAQMVGGSRESINRILQRFQEKGYVTLEQRRLVVRDLDGLAQRAGGGS